MKDEISVLGENETFEYTNLIGGKWVYTVKRDSDGEERYKARYVAKGYSQILILTTKIRSVQLPVLRPFACCYR